MASRNFSNVNRLMVVSRLLLVPSGSNTKKLTSSPRNGISNRLACNSSTAATNKILAWVIWMCHNRSVGCTVTEASFLEHHVSYTLFFAVDGERSGSSIGNFELGGPQSFEICGVNLLIQQFFALDDERKKYVNSKHTKAILVLALIVSGVARSLILLRVTSSTHWLIFALASASWETKFSISMSSLKMSFMQVRRVSSLLKYRRLAMSKSYLTSPATRISWRVNLTSL